MEHTKIPVLGHADGLCALYIDDEADLDMAVAVAVDSKCQYPAVCNAVETLLVHASVANGFLPKFKEATTTWPVTIHGDGRTRDVIDCMAAVGSDWDTEYLDYEIAVKVVDSMEEAIEHIAQHDSADVFWNCSTRFADGFRYGLGAEVGISTQKIHARGPVGLDGLVIGKWVLAGNGHIVDTYAKGKPFLHKELSIEGGSLFGEVDE
jgi:glutamate-5-semialdehyde dehydrogenase